MKKSKDITKYNIHWQILRAKLKNVKNVNEKLTQASIFFQKNKTQDNWERVVNWLEGLAKGYKAAGNQMAIQQIIEEIERYGESYNLLKEKNEISSIEEIKQYSINDLQKLWVDLFKRNEKWLKNGYVETEINNFMYNLYSSCEEIAFKPRYSYIKLQELQSKAKNKKNTHKFFF
jgi:hypothetical protein